MLKEVSHCVMSASPNTARRLRLRLDSAPAAAAHPIWFLIPQWRVSTLSNVFRRKHVAHYVQNCRSIFRYKQGSELSCQESMGPLIKMVLKPASDTLSIPPLNRAQTWSPNPSLLHDDVRSKVAMAQPCPLSRPLIAPSSGVLIVTAKLVFDRPSKWASLAVHMPAAVSYPVCLGT